ncbi:unnamed protein product [Arabidopsis lyrata]|nr:unnamed protein product [Arabidopsis lyrata]
MEQGLKQRDVVREDKISELPEALILEILSLLPTKDVIATSVLSKQWRSIWKMVPKLKFVFDYKKLAENVTRSFLSHKAPVLESLSLSVRDGYCDLDVELWAGTAIARNVREFLLFSESSAVVVTFPSSLFCCDTLETLTLINSIYVDVPSLVSMKSLRTLHLYYVEYKDNESICNLLSGCPNLEVLSVSIYFPQYETNFTIVAPSLKRLSIYGHTREKNGDYVINTPSLEYLEIGKLNGFELCLIEKTPLLHEAKIRNVSKIVDEKLLGSLKSVKRLFLDLSPFQIKDLTGIFYQLVSLEMCTREAEWWNLLTIMLDSSPKLKVLKLIGQSSFFSKDGVVGGKWNQPKNVPECLLSHLEKFVGASNSCHLVFEFDSS